MLLVDAGGAEGVPERERPRALPGHGVHGEDAPQPRQGQPSTLNPTPYRKRTPLGPYRMPMPRVLGGRGVGVLLWVMESMEKMRRNPAKVNPAPCTLHPQPATRNPQLATLDPHPSPLNLQPSTLNPQPSTLNSRHSTLNPQLSTLNPRPSTRNPQPSIIFT